MPARVGQKRPVRRRAGTRVLTGCGAYRVRSRYSRSAPMYRRPTLRGNGGYWGNVWNRITTGGRSSNELLPGAGRAVGTALGNLLGSGSIGGMAGDWLGRVSGLGAYKVSKNTILTPDPPTVSNTSSGIRIKHREYIGDVSSALTFTTQFQLPVQPGLSSAFPWLSGIAGNFSQYQFHGLIFEFITTSGNAISGTSPSLGEVLMSTNYNSIDAPFTNKQQMLNEEFSCSGVPCANLVHPIECSPKQTPVPQLYVRTSAIPAGSDARLYDLGNFQLATSGQLGSTSALGELYASYDVEFFKPQLLDDTGVSTETSMFQLINVASTTPLGSGVAVPQCNNLNITLNSLVITIPPGVSGNFLLVYQVQGTAAATTIYPSLTFSPNIDVIPAWDNSLTSEVGAPNNNVSTFDFALIVSFAITDPTVTSTIGFSNGGTIPVSAAGANLLVTQLSSTFA